MKIYENIEMKQFSNMKIGGIAKEFIFVENKDEIKEVLSTREKIFLLGNGTNTLIRDGFIDITFLSLKYLKNIVVEEVTKNNVFVRVEAGLDLDELIKFMRENNYSGLENISGIPGTVGGLVNMNGGAYGTEIFDCITEVEICTQKGELKKIKKTDMTFKYRSTQIKEEKWIVVSALFKFGFGFDVEASEDKYEQRKKKHPLDLPNLGSTFKNPTGTFAAKLISDAGLKGFRIGDIQVSEKHPNFLTNLGMAKFDDVKKLINHIQKTVKKETGIELETEIIIIE